MKKSKQIVYLKGCLEVAWGSSSIPQCPQHKYDTVKPSGAWTHLASFYTPLATRPIFRHQLTQQGFTLIEVIAALVLTGFLAAIFTPVFRQTFQKSISMMTDYHRTLYLMGVMENITAFYLQEVRRNGGEVELGVVLPPAPPKPTLQSKVGNEGTTQNNSFGQNYYVVCNRFIKFDSTGQEVPIASGDPQDLLKITIRQEMTGGPELTSLFPKYAAP